MSKITFFRMGRSAVLAPFLVASMSYGQVRAQVGIEIGSLPIPQSLSGSVAAGDVIAGGISLTLLDAIQRGVKYNIGIIGASEDVRSARAQRLQALSQLLPDLTTRTTATSQQVDLAAFGFTGFPGIPQVVGPFTVYDTRAYLTQNVLNFNARRELRARDQDLKASDLTSADTREKVVLVVTGLYLQALASAARIESASAQVSTAQTLFKNAQDRKQAGTSPAIDVLRAQVQLQSLQQRQIYYEGEFQKQLLSLARAIGLPAGQKFTLADKMLSDPLPAVPLESLLTTAYQNRRDYLSAQASLRSAELSRSAAHAERYPTVDLSANYGVIGQQPNNSHGTYAVAGGVNIPIFQGGRVAADELAADSTVKRRKADLDNLRGQIDADIRTGLIDAQNAYRQVEVARSNVSLAREELAQSQDRFRAGVANNVEVVQAQEAVATSEENLIASLYAFNIAKATLVRSQGQAEQLIVSYLKGK